ncbi:unnamed protein product, partial [marine sediment metagenome]
MSLKLSSKIKNINTDLIYNKLVKKIKAYNPDVDHQLLHKAYLISKKYHQNQYRKSGEPFVVHPLEVAGILADIELDQTSIISAILHDVIEDTDYSLEIIGKTVNPGLKKMISAVIKDKKNISEYDIGFIIAP